MVDEIDMGFVDGVVDGEPVAVVEPVELVVKKSKAELKKEEMLRAFAEGESVVSAWKRRVTPGKLIMDGVYARISKYIAGVKNGYSTGLVVVGEPGLSKSWTTKKVLDDLGGEYEFLEGYISEVELYVALYRCRNKILVLDDVFGWEKPRCLSYLKCALGSTEELNKGRKISNSTQKAIQDSVNGGYVPNSFFFEGRIIILTNSLNDKSAHVKAVISRLDHVKLVLSDTQKFNIMSEIVKNPYSSLTLSEREYCLNYLQQNASLCPSYLINLRTLKKLYDYYLFCKSTGDLTGFDVMGRGLLELDNDGIEDSDIVAVREIEKRSDLNREEKSKEFISLTGKSRPTYFRVLDRSGIKYKDGGSDD